MGTSLLASADLRLVGEVADKSDRFVTSCAGPDVGESSPPVDCKCMDFFRCSATGNAVFVFLGKELPKGED